jgi:hypothetical protein
MALTTLQHSRRHEEIARWRRFFQQTPLSKILTDASDGFDGSPEIANLAHSDDTEEDREKLDEILAKLRTLAHHRMDIPESARETLRRLANDLQDLFGIVIMHAAESTFDGAAELLLSGDGAIAALAALKRGR